MANKILNVPNHLNVKPNFEIFSHNKTEINQYFIGTNIIFWLHNRPLTHRLSAPETLRQC